MDMTSEKMQELIECRFLGDQDADFDAFVSKMPETHWSRYDLSAVRLGWEAAARLRQQSEDSARLDDLEKMISDAMDGVEIVHNGAGMRLTVWGRDYYDVSFRLLLDKARSND